MSGAPSKTRYYLMLWKTATAAATFEKQLDYGCLSVIPTSTLWQSAGQGFTEVDVLHDDMK